MLSSAETGQTISRQAFDAEVPLLRVDLLNAQFDLRNAAFPVLILVAGDDRLGCERTVDILHEWLDARYVNTHVFLEHSAAESQRPRFWRYWNALPQHGAIGLHFGAWANNTVAEHLFGSLSASAFNSRINRIKAFEKTLTDDGCLLMKFWLHLPKAAMKARLKKATRHPDRHWRIDHADWRIYDAYDRGVPIIDRFLEDTHVASSPWHVIESTDHDTRHLAVARTITARLQARLHQPHSPLSPTPVAPVQAPSALGAADLESTLSGDDYKKKLTKHQRRLHRLARRGRSRGLSSVLVFEGWDAAGKGGAIRRLTSAMPARDYKVIPIAAPTAQEKSRHYLWRFWRHVPRAGQMVIFDRSWYGRVLVERVEGFAQPQEWARAYAEILDFEEQLADHGIVVMKFWLHIDRDEQLRRFKAREQTPYKKYKITNEDYRNRERWDDYSAAVDEMIARTDSAQSPWHVVAANDKRHARIEILKTVCKGLKRGAQNVGAQGEQAS